MDIQKQCEGCFYFRPVSATGNAHCPRCCHYYLDTLLYNHGRMGEEKDEEKSEEKVKVFT